MCFWGNVPGTLLTTGTSDMVKAYVKNLIDVVGKGGGLLGIGFKRVHHIHKIQRVQLIEVGDMVLLELGPVQQVPYDAGVFGNGDTDGVFHGPHGGQVMGIGADPA